MDRQHESDPTWIDPTVVRWRTGEASGPLLVMLHGYGADENDLFALAGQVPEPFTVAAVRAPQTPPWPAPGYAWYPLDDVRVDAVADHDPSRVTAAATGLATWLDQTGFNSVGLLGFSQGASVALQAMRREPERFTFAVVLSGYVAPGSLPGDAALAQRRPPVFWGRGGRDTMIPAALIEHTAQWLPAHVELSGRLYPDLAHGVDEQEWADVRTFLQRQTDR